MSSSVSPRLVPAPEPVRDQARPSLPFTFALIAAFPVLGTVLALAGTPTSEIIPLLSYCAAIGVATVVVVNGGRRFAARLATLFLGNNQ
ncbi:hypothetical protein ACFRFJ_16090 [Streptomyces hydrogenans]|uniref:hypothetical protein n=1 Tax=Streptomyces hydrogenans TaxID=1873719 RepID=UPI0036C0C120